MRTARQMVLQLAQETGQGLTSREITLVPGRDARPYNKADGHEVKARLAVTVQRPSVGKVTMRTVRKARQGRDAAQDRIAAIRGEK